MIQVLEAVRYLHEHHIVHRDIKPENILIASLAAAARVVLCDFGSAVYLPHHVEPRVQKRMHTITGTEEYAAP